MLTAHTRDHLLLLAIGEGLRKFDKVLGS